MLNAVKKTVTHSTPTLRIWAALLLLLPAGAADAQRFPKPDFESGYTYPELRYAIPNETLWTAVDVVLLTALMGVVAWAVIRKRTRAPVVVSSVISVAYFGFFRSGCVCSIGAIQNVALALADSAYVMPPSALLFFILPIVFAILLGRVFCAGVCPMGALQELVNVKSYRLSKALTAALSVIPWIYLILAVLFAVTRSSFIICRFDPFIGLFRLGGDVGMIVFGALLLVAAIFTGRPFCRFLCPYGALLSLFARVSVWRIKITPTCISCELCHNACPVDAIRAPYANKVKESRLRGVKRVLLYLLLLPALAGAGALTLRTASNALSRVNKDVRLYDMVAQNEAAPQDVQPPELEAFYGQGGTVEELSQRAAAIQADFRRYATAAGALMGLVIGFTLTGLSLKRTRKTYEVNDAACVSCARCFSYCPQERTFAKPDLS
ncbi:MAG: 4Fe-4S binding protein [Prevotellaceae bacterium]|jgi:Fe-S-cluster-containing hydrogenase component 2|nr:4Fe-4S binding protein [Prevotellaceae bacterium]